MFAFQLQTLTLSTFFFNLKFSSRHPKSFIVGNTSSFLTFFFHHQMNHEKLLIQYLWRTIFFRHHARALTSIFDFSWEYMESLLKRGLNTVVHANYYCAKLYLKLRVMNIEKCLLISGHRRKFSLHHPRRKELNHKCIQHFLDCF